MIDVIESLSPAMLAAIIFFGLNAVVLIVVAVVAAVGTDIVIRKILGRQPTVNDWSAALTGLFVALTLPPIAPWWVAAVGSIVAIAIAKELLGGLGHNIFNPALIGRAFVHASWGGLLSIWLAPFWWKTGGFFDLAYPKAIGNKIVAASLKLGALDNITGATPLALIKPGLGAVGTKPGYLDLFLGTRMGSLGETSAIALLIGAAYLFYKGHINWRIPTTFLATVTLIAFITKGDPLYHLLSGGLILGAFFMATDWVTSPVSPRGELIFGFGCGLLTIAIRLWGGYPEGVYFAILLMNAVAPMIDKYVQPRRFGEVKAKAQA
jgi:electron transport complex protein RnfD